MVRQKGFILIELLFGIASLTGILTSAALSTITMSRETL